ncbi:MAG: hypothetical protein ACOX7W_02845 [Christensenellales bacterium]|jgi:hypothetical protein
MGERCKDAWRKNPVPLHRLSPGGGQYFFGYYDLFATSGNMHLCHRLPFIDRLHRAGDRAQLGTLPLTGGEFTPFDDTAAWCFQQGAMMQFVPGLPDTVLYNVEHKDGYGARMRNLRTGAAREYGRPVSALSPDGTFFLSVNMARLYDFRPGYGYAGIPDPYGSEAAPRTDGVWRVDMGTGRETLLVTLATLQKLAGDYFVAGEKLCINHITVAPGGRRYVMLLRNMEKRPWRTLVLTADCGGAGEPFVILDDTYASHYWWQDTDRLLFHCRVAGQNDMYTLHDGTRRAEAWDPGYFAFDGHMRTAPGGKWLSYDSYPDAEGKRRLLVYDTVSGTGFELARLHGHNPDPADIRCDLHPRWSHDGAWLTFDSVHEGFRGVYAVSVADLPGA